MQQLPQCSHKVSASELVVHLKCAVTTSVGSQGFCLCTCSVQQLSQWGHKVSASTLVVICSVQQLSQCGHKVSASALVMHL